MAIKETPTYPGYGFANALDGDPNDDYVAGIEGEKESVVEVTLEPHISPTELRIIWESKQNFAKSVKVYGVADETEGPVLIGEAQTVDFPITRIPLRAKAKTKSVEIHFSQFSGQSRLLLRKLEIR